MTTQPNRAGSTSKPCPTCGLFMNPGGYCADQWHRPVTAQPSPDLPQARIERSRAAMIETAAEWGIGCPTCRTILRDPTCPDPWHFDNRPQDLPHPLPESLRRDRKPDEYRAANITVEQGQEAVRARLEAEVQRLRQHILDIDAHATPYGDIPREPGWVGMYLLTAGALHRALGTIGHSAPNCQAEADLAAMTARAESAEAMARDCDLDERTIDGLADTAARLARQLKEQRDLAEYAVKVADVLQNQLDRRAATERQLTADVEAHKAARLSAEAMYDRARPVVAAAIAWLDAPVTVEPTYETEYALERAVNEWRRPSEDDPSASPLASTSSGQSETRRGSR